MKLISKNKVRLLKVFYAHPGKQFYIQELGRVLGTKPGVFQRALNNLYNEGLLLSEYKANARFFSINRQHPIYSELKSIISKSAKVLLFVFLFCAPHLYAQEKPLTLKDAILTAYKNNKDLQMQEKGVEAARADILEAPGVYLNDG